MANDLSRLERIGSTSLRLLGVFALLPAICSVLSCEIEAALRVFGGLDRIQESQVSREDLDISWLVHVFDYLLPDSLFHQYLSVLDHGQDPVQLSTRFSRILVSESLLEQLLHTTLDRELNIPELLVYLVSKHLAKQENLMVLGLESLDGVDD